MRLSELLGRSVFDVDGYCVGSVADVILVQDGPVIGGRTAALRVAGLIVVHNRYLELFGYERDLRPAVFRGIVRRLAGQTYQVPQGDIAALDSGRILLRTRADDLQPHTREARW